MSDENKTEPLDERSHVPLMIGGGVALALIGALYFGAQVGTSRGEREAKQDPIQGYRAELRSLERAAQQYAPALLGYSRHLPPPDMGPIERLEQSAAELSARAGKAGIPLEMSDVDALLRRARFEHAMRTGSLTAASAILQELGGNEAHMLRVRLEWARGKEPDPAWLRSWINSSDPDMAQTARVLLARRIGAERPDEALALLQVNVHPLVAKPERARVRMLQAVDRLEPHKVASLLRQVEGVQRFPKARARTIEKALALCNDPDSTTIDLIRALKVLAQLKGPSSAEGKQLAQAALAQARLVEARVIAMGPGKERRALQLIELVEAFGRTLLRAGNSRDGDLLVDQVVLLHTKHRLLDAAQLARALLAMVRLDVRLGQSHLQAASLAAVQALAPETAAEYLRRRVQMAQGKAIEEARRALYGLQNSPRLGPFHRARAIALALPARPPGAERGRLAQAAVIFDPHSPWTHLAQAWALASSGKVEGAREELQLARTRFAKRFAKRPAPVVAAERKPFARDAEAVEALLAKAKKG